MGHCSIVPSHRKCEFYENSTRILCHSENYFQHVGNSFFYGIAAAIVAIALAIACDYFIPTYAIVMPYFYGRVEKYVTIEIWQATIVHSHAIAIEKLPYVWQCAIACDLRLKVPRGRVMVSLQKKTFQAKFQK